MNKKELYDLADKDYYKFRTLNGDHFHANSYINGFLRGYEKREEESNYLHERVSIGLKREIERQKAAGKEFLSNEEIDTLIDKIIKEELGDSWKEKY